MQQPAAQGMFKIKRPPQASQAEDPILALLNDNQDTKSNPTAKEEEEKEDRCLP